jgi:Zn ribbon nucleic-acid-binding protein
MDSMLAEHGQDLYQSIASSPIQWGMLAMRIRSFNILREAVIHLTGQWKSVTEDEKKSMDQNLRVLVEAKDNLLDRAKIYIETRLANWYPPELHRRAAAAARRAHGHAEYAKQIIKWIALCILRQWICYAVIHGWLRNGPDGGLTCYKRIAAGGSAYLSPENLAEWHKNFTMSSRTQNNLAACLDRMKIGIKEVVKPLLKNESALNISAYPVKYFTCTMVDKRDTLTLWEEDTLEWDQPVVASCGADESTTPKRATSQAEQKPNKETKGNNPQSTALKRAAEEEAPEANKTARLEELSTPEGGAEQEMLESGGKAGEENE